MNVEEYRRMFELEERQWWYAGMRAITTSILAPALAGQAGARILDAGCGTGTNLKHLAAWGRPVGVDLSEEAVRLSRNRGVTVARGSVLALPFAGASFDLVTSFDVIYHRWVDDDRAALAELVRVLRPNGFLFVRVPALKMLWGAHDEAVHSRHRYTRREIVDLFAACGLTVERATYCNSLLFPLLAVRRTLDRLLHRHGSDVEELPAPLERVFRGLLGLEARWLRRFTFPVGASVIVFGRKPLGR